MHSSEEPTDEDDVAVTGAKPGLGQSVYPAGFEMFAGAVTGGGERQEEERTRAPHQVELATIMGSAHETDKIVR